MSHEPPRCGYCAHRRYLLSCGEYDVLVTEYESLCAICRRAGHETGHGFLCVDHDPFIGQWAVRGLLCSSCNGRLSIDPAWRPEAVSYLADPWYLRRFAALGFSIEPVPEPPVGSKIADGKRPWHRTQRGWECLHRDGPRGALSWDALNRCVGPHRISVLASSRR